MLLLSTVEALPLAPKSAALACTQPDVWSVAAAFDLAASGRVVAGSGAQGNTNAPVVTVPASLLKAIGWVESKWQQFTPQGHPLLSPDFGYGIMQVTSGMAGAFGNATGDIDPASQSAIASDYRFNIAYGASILRQKWARVPSIGNGDPAVLEDWYYAVWAYNGWGWVNNPNNPRFTRVGTPATNPSTYPYEERVFYLVSHPPRDRDGNPLWRPIPVKLPSRTTIGSDPGSFDPMKMHREPSPAIGAVYEPAPLSSLPPGGQAVVRVRLVNTGTQPWLNAGSAPVSLTYHVFTDAGDPLKLFSPFSPGVLAYGQHPVLIPRNVLPGGSITVVQAVHAPSQPGAYRIVWDLQEGDTAWISQQHVLPRVQKIDVGSNLPTPTPKPITIPKRHPAEGNQYLRDTAIPDGTVLRPGEHFVKGWLVFNSGSKAWGPGWTLRLVSGKNFGAARVPLPPTTGCSSANLLVPMAAPKRIGSYKSVWRAQDPNGHLFGQKLTVVVVVRGGGAGGSPTPIPSPTAPLGTPRPTPTPTPSG